MSFNASSATGRGGFAPRRGRGGKSQLFIKRNDTEPNLDKHRLGNLLVVLGNEALDPTEAYPPENTAIEDNKYVASYNWIDTKFSTIMVPGKPPLWTPLQHPRRLEEDSGKYFRDPNAARFPSYPTEPAVQALLNTNPTFPTEEVDVFCCGSTMGSLLRFVRKINKPFRFSVEVIGNTVFLVRKENDPKQTIDDIHGYGHTFPDSYTTWESDVKGSESHQRLNQYTFGGLKCIIRFECDGYLMDSSTSETACDSKPSKEAHLDDILKGFEDTAIKRPLESSDTLAVRSGGSTISQDTIFDLKTRSSRFNREIDMSDIYPLLWLKQIPNFVVAYHDGFGTFHKICVKDVKHDVQAWEQENKAAIQRLAVLLKKIVDIARQDGTSLLEVYSPRADRLEVRKQYGKGVHALPLNLREKWDAVDDDADTVAGHEDLYGSANKTRHRFGALLGDDSDDEKELDFTACSTNSCGYCGRCSY